MGGGRYRALLLAGPLLLLLAWVAYPLARGSETLYLRDVLNAHFPMKQAQAEALRQGYVPEIDPCRAGGQPLAGNPNAVPFYPDNVLYLWRPALWALNAHFWLHLLLAPFAFYWLVRAWGLAREPAWAAAVLWTASGFFLSHLAFYNLIAGVTLAPAFAGAALDLAAEGRRRRWTAPALALLWALLLLAGDPLMAALGLFLAGTAVALRAWAGRRGWYPGEDPAGATRVETSRPALGRPFWLLAAAALACGTLLAAPQIIEFLRILPLSFRGYWGYRPGVSTVASWDPRQILEWLLPFAYGRPDLHGLGRFWGERFYTGVPAYYFTLYPGLAALALVAAAGRPRTPAARWAWAMALFGLFFALGRFNPLATGLFRLAGGGALRYPVKFWLPVAAGAALLGGIGFGRLLAGPGRRAFAWTLAFLSLVLTGLLLHLAVQPAVAESWLRRLIPATFPDPFVTNERLRWSGLCLASLLLLAALALAARLLRSRPLAGGSLLLALHSLTQILLLRPAFPMDATLPYLTPPPALAEVPRNLPVVHGAFAQLFGPSNLTRGDFPGPTMQWVERRAFFELYPFTGPLWQRRYELNVSPEGLDSFLTRVSQGAIKGADDAARVRLLAAWGVGRLLLDRPLAEGTPGADLLAAIPSSGQHLYIYAIPSRSPAIFLARRVLPAPHLNAAYSLLADPHFDPSTDAVVPGEGPSREGPGGRVRLLAQGPEALHLEVDSPAGGLLVLQRSHLPLWKATLDGRPIPIQVANLQRMGVEVPPGRHQVQLRIDRRPLRLSFAGTAAGLLGLVVLLTYAAAHARPVRRPPPPAHP